MDLGAERAVLAGIFSYGLESYVEVCDIIDSDSFSHKNNQVIFKCIEKIIKDGAEIDLPSLLSAAKKLDLQDIINSTQELEYINSLMEYPIKKDNVLYFAAQIKKFEFARKIKKLTNKIGRDIDDINGDESIDEIINILENPITDFLREDIASKISQFFPNIIITSLDVSQDIDFNSLIVDINYQVANTNISDNITLNL